MIMILLATKKYEGITSHHLIWDRYHSIRVWFIYQNVKKDWLRRKLKHIKISILVVTKSQNGFESTTLQYCHDGANRQNPSLMLSNQLFGSI